MNVRGVVPGRQANMRATTYRPGNGSVALSRSGRDGVWWVVGSQRLVMQSVRYANYGGSDIVHFKLIHRDDGA